MCGAFGIKNDNPQLRDFNRILTKQSMRNDGWQNCGQTIEIILSENGQNVLSQAIWWLLLEKDSIGKYKPHSKYTTFNSRWHEGSGFSLASANPFKTSRCIIPATSFIESQNKQYWHLEAIDQPIAFGGLYKQWDTEQGSILSCSLITIPPHPRMEHIHKKAMPLMLPVNDTSVIEAWLDESNSKIDIFLDFMQPRLNSDFTVTALSKWGSFTPQAGSDSFKLQRDS